MSLELILGPPPRKKPAEYGEPREGGPLTSRRKLPGIPYVYIIDEKMDDGGYTVDNLLAMLKAMQKNEEYNEFVDVEINRLERIEAGQWLYDFKKDYEQTIKDYAYLVVDKNVVGVIDATTPVLGNSIDIHYTGIHSRYRGRGWCKIILGAFIRGMERKYAPDVYSFDIQNIGGRVACRCYLRSFQEEGYDGTLSINLGEYKPFTMEDCDKIPVKKEGKSAGSQFLTFTKRK